MAFKVVVLANSFPLKVRPSRETHDQGTYAEWVQRLLESRYRNEPIQVHNFGRFLGMLHHGISIFDPAVSAIGPDVVIINYGGNECFPRYLPMWFMEFMARYRLSSNRFAYAAFKLTDAAHVLLMRPFISFFRPSGWYTMAKFRGCLTKLIQMAIAESRAHIIVMNLPDIHHRVEYLIPGARRRIVEFNDAIAEVCREHGATLIDLYNWIGQDFDGMMPDSFHLNAKAHRMLGEWVTREIVQFREEAAAGRTAGDVAPLLQPRRPSAATRSVWKEKTRMLVARIGTALGQRADKAQEDAKRV